MKYNSLIQQQHGQKTNQCLSRSYLGWLPPASTATLCRDRLSISPLSPTPSDDTAASNPPHPRPLQTDTPRHSTTPQPPVAINTSSTLSGPQSQHSDQHLIMAARITNSAQRIGFTPLASSLTRSMSTTTTGRKREFLAVIPDKPGMLQKRLQVRQ